MKFFQYMFDYMCPASNKTQCMKSFPVTLQYALIISFFSLYNLGLLEISLLQVQNIICHLHVK